MSILKSRFQIVRFGVLMLFITMQIFLIFIKRHDALDLDISPNTVPTPNIHGLNQIGQTFIAKRDNIARIDIMLGTHGKTNTGPVTFRLWELSSPRKQEVNISFEASEVGNNLYHSLRFKPIRDSQDRNYFFLLTAPKATAENSISAWMNDRSIYREGEYWFQNQKATGDLVFRVYSKRPIAAELGRIVRNYEGIFGSKTVLIIAITLFELAQVMMLWWLLGYIYRSWINS
jgi:hypothetical protein